MQRANLFERLLLVVLSFQIALSPTLAFARVTPTAVEQAVKEASEFEKFIQQSHEIPKGQPRGTYAPDRFLLLEQEAHVASRVGRAFGVFSTAVERDLEVHRQRVRQVSIIREQALGFLNGTEIKNPCDAYANDASVSESAIQHHVLMHLRNERPQDTPPVIWDAKGDVNKLACIEDRVKWLMYKWNSQVVDMWETRASIVEVPNITLADAQDKTTARHQNDKSDKNYYPSTIEKRRFYNWWDVKVDVQTKAGDEILETIKMKTSADHHSIDDSTTYNCTNGDSCKFELKSNNGIKLNTFHVPVKAITTFGPYVVFVHNDSYDAESGIQYLSFLDLATYGPALGRADIPVFRVPIATTEEVTSLSVKNKKLLFNGGKTQVIVEGFMAASELQQIAFNILSNLTEMKDIAEILPYLDRLREAFRKIVNAEIEDATDPANAKPGTVLLGKLGADLKTQILQNKNLAEFVAGKKTIVTKEDAAQLAEDVKKIVEGYGRGVEQSKELNERMAKTGARMTSSRKLSGQLEAFFKKIMSPSPNASLKIKRALVTVGAYRDMEQGKWWNFLADRPWLHSTMLSAGLMAGVTPEAFMHVLDASLALGNGFFDYGKYALLGLGEAVVTGTKATFSPLASLGDAFYDQYIGDGNAPKTLIGLGTFIPFLLSLYYVPHMLFNVHHLWLDSKKPGYDQQYVARTGNKWIEKVLRMSNNLVVHQRQFTADYYKRLADDEAKRREIKEENAERFTAEEEVEIRDWLQNRKAENAAKKENPGFISRFINKFRKQKSELDQAAEASPAVKEAADVQKIRGLWQALTSITFSYPAMELTMTRWMRFWNWFAGTRFSSVGFLTLRDVGLKYNMPIFIRVKPISATVRMLFPDFFTTMVVKRGPKVTIPTLLNGGTRGWEMRDMVWLKESLFGKPSEMREAEEDVAREATRSELKALTETFEREILAVEDQVHKEAFQAALRALPEFIADKEQLLKVYTDKPLTSAMEKRMRELPSEVRTFLRLYYEEVYGATMAKYLAGVVAREDGEIQDPEGPGLSLQQLKDRLIESRKAQRAQATFQFNPEEAVAIARAHVDDKEMFERISKQARKGELSISNWILNRKYNLMGDMDPGQNPSMRRFSVVQERMKSANAVERAVRAEVSKLLYTLPADIIFKMVLTAGIVEGVAKPIQEHLWGPNSIGYFSITGWYMLMGAGFALSMMADGWLKLQTDDRQDSLGDFGAVPRGEDAERSFFSWFRKQFSAKHNSITANWANSASITFWNMPAALVNLGLLYTMFSGRLDLSYLLAGYVVSFGTPLSAFYYKLEQAFERAVEYSARGIKDEKWMAHPEVQAMVAAEKQRYRNRFQLLMDTYGNVMGNLVTNIEMVKTSYGTRGFARAIFGGPMIEETIIEKLLRPAAEATQNVPGVGSVVKKIADSCEFILSNGNTDLNLKK